MQIEIIYWDLEDEPAGNIQHIAEHGISIEEFEEVVLNSANAVVESRSSDNLITFKAKEVVYGEACFRLASQDCRAKNA